MPTNEEFSSVVRPFTNTVIEWFGPKPEIVCVCGSARFQDEISEYCRRSAIEGALVLAPDFYVQAGDSQYLKSVLDRTHMRKIDMCDRIHVVCPGGYVGVSTLAEIAYATKRGKVITSSHPYGGLTTG